MAAEEQDTEVVAGRECAPFEIPPQGIDLVTMILSRRVHFENSTRPAD